MKKFFKNSFSSPTVYLELNSIPRTGHRKRGVLVDIFKSGYFEKWQIDFSKNIAIVPSKNDHKR